MDRCLVTGGGGFIGSHMAEALVRKGCRGRVLDNFSTGTFKNIRFLKKNVEIIRGDIRDSRICQKAVSRCDRVFHFAALKSIPKSFARPFHFHDVSVNGTLHLLDASLKNGIRRFIHASSSSVYGKAVCSVLKEDGPTLPVSPYGIAKMAAEHHVFSYHFNHGLDVVALRYFNVFGPRQAHDPQYPAVVPAFIHRLRRNRSPLIYGDGLQRRHFTYVKDIVGATLKAAVTPEAAGHVFNIASSEEHSILDIYRTVARILGKKNIRPEFLGKRLCDLRRVRADFTKAKNILKWKTKIGFEKGLENTVSFYNAH